MHNIIAGRAWGVIQKSQNDNGSPINTFEFSSLMCFVEAHESVANFASAYSLGKTESAAALNLMYQVPAVIKLKLASLVRSHPCFFLLALNYVFPDVSS